LTRARQLSGAGHIGEPLSRRLPTGFALTVTTVRAGRPSAECLDRPPPRRLVSPATSPGATPSDDIRSRSSRPRTGRLYHSTLRAASAWTQAVL